ncbi:MAG: peptidoglycan-associated lipoprotein Pal [Gemmatimonadota bacterium]
MGRTGVLAGVILMTGLLAACGGKQPPPPVEPQPAAAPPPAPPAGPTAAEREAAANRLCERARAALEAGSYDSARELYRQVQRDYPGTACAGSAAAAVERVSAIETIRARIHFEFDKSRITDEAAAILQAKAEVLRRHPNLRLTIEGHCDERGSLEYNQALGQRRSESARRYLVSLGLDADRFRTVSFGEERPLVQGSNERAWAANRRAEFVITDMGDL